MIDVNQQDLACKKKNQDAVSIIPSRIALYKTRAEKTMIKEKEKRLTTHKFKRVNIAIIGEGRVYGDDDAIAVRPYQSSLRCISQHA